MCVLQTILSRPKPADFGGCAAVLRVRTDLSHSAEAPSVKHSGRNRQQIMIQLRFVRGRSHTLGRVEQDVGLVCKQNLGAFDCDFEMPVHTACIILNKKGYFGSF